MKKNIIPLFGQLTVLLIGSSFVIGQSNRVGIGTASPHPNTILHLQSNNHNQGLMLTRLTPGQMNAGAMVNNLTETEKGLVVYDSVRNGIYMWDGFRWKASWVKRMPFVDSLENAPNGTNMIGYRYKGNTGASVGVLYLENQDSMNAFAPVFSLSNSKVGGAGVFITNHLSGAGNSLSATNFGLGRAGRFTVNNAQNNSIALQVSTNGQSSSVAFLAENTGTGAGIVGISNGISINTAAVYGEHKGTGSAAGVFRITNANNTSPALFSETNGSGAALFASAGANGHSVYGVTNGSGNAVFGAQTGSGRAVQGQITNPTNSESAIRGFTDGLGRAGFFTVQNTANNAAGILATHNGTGSAIQAENTGNALALFLAAGGLKLSTTTLSTGTNIQTRSVVYDIAGGGPYTIGFSISNGELFVFYNRTAATVTVNGISIPSNQGVICLVIDNVLRSF